MSVDTTTKSAEAKIAKLKDELAKAEEELKQARDLTPEQDMAIALHARLCHSEHTERCGWYYEVKGDTHEWLRYTHGRYLRAAKSLIERGIDIDQVDTIFELTRGL